LGVRKDGTAFGILIDNTWKLTIELNNPIKVIQGGPASRVIIVERDNPLDIVKILAKLTGTIDMPPLWALGYQQCRYSYFPDTRVKEVASEFRKRKLPCDVIWMDIHYMQDFRIFTFDSIRFPESSVLNKYLHTLDFKTVWMIDPGVKREDGYFVYDQGRKGNYWVKASDGTNFCGKVWPGECVFPDFTNPGVCRWWGGLYKDFMSTGIDGVWNDMNEPSVFEGPDGTMPGDNLHKGGGKLKEDKHFRYHNVYGMMMVKATREGILNANPNKRPFVLSRSNYLGGQRYAATWTGDNASSAEHMKMSIPMVLNLGLSGQPFSGPDIGGYKGSPDTVLFADWMATGVFYPFCRNHTELGSKDQEPWAFGEEVEEVSRIALERRYRLMPYLYTLFYEAASTGLPVMRPVFFADPSDLSLRDEQEAFLCGQDLLVVPKWATDPDLPRGIWRTISLVGEDSKQDPFQPEIKQKGGSIIPLGKVIQSTSDYKTDSVTLLVCPNGQLEAEGCLYNDAGDGFDYLDGDYELCSFSAHSSHPGVITVTCKQSGGNPDAGKNRFYRVGIVLDSGVVYSGWENDNSIDVTVTTLRAL
jgi:alpha-glucosidase